MDKRKYFLVMLEIFIVILIHITERNYPCRKEFIKIKKYFTNPITEIYLLFFQATIPIFKKLKLLLQRADPIVFYYMTSSDAFLITCSPVIFPVYISIASI